MHFKNTINETKNKKNNQIKLRLKMLVGLQPIYLLDVLCKRACEQSRLVQPLATSKSLSFPSKKQVVGSFLT